MKPTYEELELQLEESPREFRAADATIHNLELQLTEMAVQLANAESKCRELAAENSALKATCDDRRTFIMNGVQLGYIKVPTVDTDPALETIRIAVSPQAPTPATDAFLSEVRAQGVERMIEVKQQQLDGMHPDTFAIGAVRDSIRRDIYELKVFAEILRQEAAQ
ncbi:hypothetical protein L2173_22225 [Citrobacter portucalensis]|nr:hypothetical protein [Citrobacter portucalensis]MDE9706067.1 hypothetical protein [Citrobacter portucalensis]